MKDSHLSLGAADHEMQLVRAFFGETKGYFVMGANETSAMSACRASRLQTLDQIGAILTTASTKAWRDIFPTFSLLQLG